MDAVGLPAVVSLFSGAGGLDVGLERAGFKVVVATDFDRDCVASLRASQKARIAIPNAGDRPYLDGTRIIEAAVEDLQPSDLVPEDAQRGWRPAVLAGGPPCQPFSSAGKMLSLDDPRGQLFYHFVRLARGLRPHLILFENVSGLVTARGPSGQPGEALILVKEAFESLGYGARFALLNAADYGSPQRRVRCFMVASRLEPLPEFPVPTHSEDGGATLFGGMQPWATLGEFLGGRGSPTAFEIERPSTALAAKLADVPLGSGLKSHGARETTRPGGHWGYKQGTWIADPSRPARTVTAATAQDWVREPDGNLRRLTWRECAALQGFPEEWVFVGKKASRFRQIGNAVPAVFGEAIGRSLADALRCQRRRRAASAPLPERFAKAIEYTRREHARNGASREQAKLLARQGVRLHEIKGLGSDDPERLSRAS